MILQAPTSLGRIPTKIISLVPSQTELLYFLGLEAETIAITKFCVHPESGFQNKIRIGGTKTIDIEKINSLAPDLIIANKEENIKSQVEKLAEKFPVWLTDVNNISGALKMIEDIGQLTGKKEKATSLVNSIEKGCSELPATMSKFKTAYLIWKDPYMTVGGDTFIHSMLETAGFENIFNSFNRYPEITLAQLSSLDCELILLASEPYPFKKKHLEELQAIMPSTKILLVDGEMFSWYGSRLLHAPAYFSKLMNEIHKL